MEGWRDVGQLSVGRSQARAVTMDTGSVLIVGGFDTNSGFPTEIELFNPCLEAPDEG